MKKFFVSCLVVGLLSPLSGTRVVNADTVGGQFEVLAQPEIELAEADFGRETAMSGDGRVMAIAAPFYDLAGLSTVGMVRTYVREGNTWTTLPQDFIGSETNQELGYALALNEDGTYLAITSRRVTVNSTLGFGQVTVYKRQGSTWDRVGSAITGSTAAETLGYDLAISADGQTLALASAQPFASVYRLNTSSGNYEQLGSNITTDGNSYSIDISDDGNSIIVGQSQHDIGADTDIGRVQAFVYSNGSWNPFGGNIDGLDAGDRMGQGVQMSGDGAVIAVSAPGFDGNVVDGGLVSIYRLDSNSWTQVGSRIVGINNEQIGSEIALSADGSTIAVRSFNFTVDSSNVGAVRIYSIGATSIEQKGSDIYGAHAVSRIGVSIGIDRTGESLVIGQSDFMPGHIDGNTTKKGNAIVIGALYSSDASLASLIASTTNVRLVSGQLTYQLSVPNKTKTITVTATPANAQSTVTINDVAAVQSGNSITLKPGKNIITIIVTAGARNSETYSLTITRERRRLKIRKAITMRTALASVDKTIPKGSTVRVSVARSSRTRCAATATQVRALLKTGTCRLSVFVTPKATKKNKNPKAVKSTVLITIYK